MDFHVFVDVSIVSMLQFVIAGMVNFDVTTRFLRPISAERFTNNGGIASAPFIKITFI